MIVCRLSRFLKATVAVALVAVPAFAQYGPGSAEVQPNNYPPALPARRGPGPSLVFERLGEVALPGPLGTAASRVADGLIVVPVASGFLRVAPEIDATPSLVASVELPESPEWVESSNGKRRFRTTREGLVEAQHRRRAKSKWRASWHLVAPNSILAPPVLIGPRLCYAGLDDRVTCVRASNGHRLWAVDVGDRLSRGLTCWPACSDRVSSGELLLVVPDDGASVVALDAYDGRHVAEFDLPPTHRFVSSALVVARERIVVARTGYDEQEAALVLLRLRPPPPVQPRKPVPYNDGSPVKIGTPGR